jgi:hypothetical protein
MVRAGLSAFKQCDISGMIVLPEHCRSISYKGAKQSPVPREIEVKSSKHEIKGNGEFIVSGSSIVRKFAVDHVRSGVRMNVFFDDEDTPAIEVDIAV